MSRMWRGKILRYHYFVVAPKITTREDNVPYICIDNMKEVHSSSSNTDTVDMNVCFIYLFIFFFFFVEGR